MNRFDLEKEIMQAWMTCEDINLILWRLMDCTEEPSEDELSNLLIGLSSLHESRMQKVWECFTQIIKRNGFHQDTSTMP
jgi:hypothetical protein